MITKGEIPPVLNGAEIDKCIPTKKQLDKFLAEPDDEIAARVKADCFENHLLISKIILLSRNIAQAQRDADMIWYEQREEKSNTSP